MRINLWKIKQPSNFTCNTYFENSTMDLSNHRANNFEFLLLHSTLLDYFTQFIGYIYEVNSESLIYTLSLFVGIYAMVWCRKNL